MTHEKDEDNEKEDDLSKLLSQFGNTDPKLAAKLLLAFNMGKGQKSSCEQKNTTSAKKDPADPPARSAPLQVETCSLAPKNNATSARRDLADLPAIALPAPPT